MSVAQSNVLFIFVTLSPLATAIADRRVLHQPLYPIDWTAPSPPSPPPSFPSQPTKIPPRDSRGASRGIAIAVSLAIAAIAFLSLSTFLFLKRRRRFAARRKYGCVPSSLAAGAAVSSDPLYLGAFKPSSSGKLSENLSTFAPQRPDNLSPTQSRTIGSKENELLTTQADGKSSPALEPAHRSGRKQLSKPSPLPPALESQLSRPSGRRRWVKPTSPDDIPVPLAETESDDRRDNEP